MSTGAQLHAALFALLQGIGHLDTHAGAVPQNPGDPYAVLWSGAGTALREETADRAPVEGIDWTAQITVAATNEQVCLDAAAAVRAAVLGARLVPGATRLREDGPARTAALDTAVNPPRFFVPIPVRCQTP